MRRLRMTTRRWMVAVAVVALGLYRPELGMLALVLTLATVAVHCAATRPAGSPPRRTAVSFLVTLACLYTPYLWLVFLNHQWDPYRWYWVRLWPVLPGFAVGLCSGHQNETMMSAIMAVGTVFE